MQEVRYNIFITNNSKIFKNKKYKKEICTYIKYHYVVTFLLLGW
jgi:hypothetical protein